MLKAPPRVVWQPCRVSGEIWRPELGPSAGYPPEPSTVNKPLSLLCPRALAFLPRFWQRYQFNFPSYFFFLGLSFSR